MNSLSLLRSVISLMLELIEFGVYSSMCFRYNHDWFLGRCENSAKCKGSIQLGSRAAPFQLAARCWWHFLGLRSKKIRCRVQPPSYSVGTKELQKLLPSYPMAFPLLFWHRFLQEWSYIIMHYCIGIIHVLSEKSSVSGLRRSQAENEAVRRHKNYQKLMGQTHPLNTQEVARLGVVS